MEKIESLKKAWNLIKRESLKFGRVVYEERRNDDDYQINPRTYAAIRKNLVDWNDSRDDSIDFGDDWTGHRIYNILFDETLTDAALENVRNFFEGIYCGIDNGAFPDFQSWRRETFKRRALFLTIDTPKNALAYTPRPAYQEIVKAADICITV